VITATFILLALVLLVFIDDRPAAEN